MIASNSEDSSSPYTIDLASLASFCMSSKIITFVFYIILDNDNNDNVFNVANFALYDSGSSADAQANHDDADFVEDDEEAHIWDANYTSSSIYTYHCSDYTHIISFICIRSPTKKTYMYNL